MKSIRVFAFSAALIYTEYYCGNCTDVCCLNRMTHGIRTAQQIDTQMTEKQPILGLW